MASVPEKNTAEIFRPQAQRAMEGAKADSARGGPAEVAWYTAHGTLDDSLEPMLDDESFAAVDR